MAIIEKRLSRAADDIAFVVALPDALPALDRNALVLALVSVQSALARYRKACEVSKVSNPLPLKADAPPRVEGDPGF